MSRTRCVIGVDESGKGDFFGPLVVAAVAAADDDVSALHELGVRDGKLIADRKLLGIDELLRGRYVHHVVVLSPAEYNRRYEKIKNLNKLLAECHGAAILSVLSRQPADLVVSDKFGKTELVEEVLARHSADVNLKQIVRGESVAQVAAASIVARAAFLRELSRLSAEVGCELPKGAGAPVDKAGRELASKQPVSIFDRVAKRHFKNFKRIVNPELFRR